MNTKESDALDLIWGAEEMARVIGRTPAQVYNMLRQGHLPAKQVGERWVIPRAKLVAFFLGEAA